MPTPYIPPDPTNPAARRPLQPGEAEAGAKQLEALNWSREHAPNDPNGQQILASQYLYKKYGMLPNNGIGDWQHQGGGGPLGWELVNGDLVPKDRSWWDKYGMVAVAAGILTAGTASAVLGGAAPAASSGAASTAAGGGTIPAAGAAAPAVAGGSSVIPWNTIIGAGSQLFGNLFAANQQSNAATTNAAAEAAAAKYAADKIAEANAASLKFQYGTAENAFQNNEASRQGNYGIFAARERRLGTIGEEVGLGPREIPAYVPGVDPGFGTMGEAATGTAPAPAAAGGAGNPRDPNAIMAALTKNYQALGVSPSGRGSGPTDIAYMAEEMANTGGLTPGNTGYWLGPQGRIAKELAARGGGAAAPVQGAPVARAAAPATAATPFMPAAVRAGPQSIGYYA